MSNFFPKIKHYLAKIKENIWPGRFDGWIRIYPTLQCNLDCAYCIHSHNLADSKADEFQVVPWQRWAEFINQSGKNVIFTGGEPFLYPDFVKLLNAISADIKVKIYSNLSADMQDYIKNCRRPVIFFGTYHPAGGPVEKFIDTINALRAAGKFKGSIHMIGWTNQLEYITKAKEKFAQQRWYVYIDKDQYLQDDSSSMKFKKKARCTRRIYLLAPDGRRYLCISKMLRQKDALGNVLETGLGTEQVTMECQEYGYCNPCDRLGSTRIKPVKE
ncbi:MAG: radical SAM protein [bacterium]|nr:radical SAM protein [bacterium]MDD5755700.1 radical SAM protein [bacterium]